MKRVLTGWHFMRVLRLALGGMVVWQGIQLGDWAPVVLGGLFMLMAVTNTGCCGANGCAAPGTYNKPAEGTEANEATFEEVKGH